MRCEETFSQIYRKDAEDIAFCPYRICPIGAHVDHQLGKITGFAIDKGIYFAYSAKHNGVIELTSLQFDKRAQFHIREVPDVKQDDWADYLRGVTIELSQKHTLSVGLCGVIEGTLPIGGLSSSASVTLVYLKALCQVNNIRISKVEMIMMAMGSENHYVGVNSGKLDQSCEMFAKKDHLLYLDTKDDTFELIPTSASMKPYEIAIFFSGVERTLAGSKFNMRVDECRSAAYALMAYSGMEYGKFQETFFRNVPREVYEKYKEHLPENWRRRAEHWFTEQERVVAGAEAWRSGDIEEYGRLSFQSGKSSIYNWETGSPELKTLYDIMTHTDGIYGGRFSGAGFKGCCMALIDPAFEDSIREKVTSGYLKAFPDLRDRYSMFICHSADGVEL